MSRAYTYIDVSRAIIGNRWIERVWSAFMGTTVELRAANGGSEWLTAPSPELRLVVNGAAMVNMDFGAAEWSETANPFGAVLSATRSGTSPEILLRTLCFHEAPVMVRTMTLLNTGKSQLMISDVALDLLPVQPGRVLRPEVQQQGASFAGAASDRVFVVMRGVEALVLGIEGGGRYELFQPQEQLCSLHLEDSFTLEPGEFHTLPDTYLGYFTGDPASFLSQDFAEALRLRREWRAWETRRTLEAVAES